MFLALFHTDLDIFKISKLFVLLCYKETNTFPQDEKYALRQQIRRAALSVHLNIAEGSSRKSSMERKRFYEIAGGSLIEVDTALDIALELGYLDAGRLEVLGQYLLRSFQMLSKMIDR